ncbi:hypothetical protein GIB67_026711 [Kingdonia uniflora]|uniref:Leucine-rich repeat-containing N-terminal plant-type domain-containing protein n=1 Tax=Kingdonia uniflora TaxID=39325 RepID=A0A7J7M274_9MAGN|nr:hypothetical protein GIB67_026711 [Kingdonia uniflora]
MMMTVMAGYRESSQQGDDVKALMVFKSSSIQNDPKGLLKSWNSNLLTPCEWKEVICTPDGRVTSLDISNYGLTGRLHIDDLMALQKLQHLHLRGNIFFDNQFLGEILKNLDRLVRNFKNSICLEINSQGNFLRVLSPVLLWKVSTLETIRYLILVINDNFITGTNPPSLANCANLTWVMFSNNKITGKVSTEIGSLKNLVVLQLSNNSLTREITAKLGKCESLIRLNLSSNKLSRSIPRELPSQSV